MNADVEWIQVGVVQVRAIPGRQGDRVLQVRDADTGHTVDLRGCQQGQFTEVLSAARPTKILDGVGVVDADDVFAVCERIHDAGCTCTDSRCAARP